MGLVAYKDGDYQLSASYFQDALASWQSLGFSWGLACCIPGHLGEVARAEGHLSRAMTFYQECLSLNWTQRGYENVSWSLVGLAVILAANGEAERVARMLGLVDQLQELIDAPLMPDVGSHYDNAMRLSIAALGAERFAIARAVGVATDLAEGVAQARALARSEVAPKVDLAASFGLTAREQEVLRLLAAGNSNQQIADALFISPGTAKLHVSHILSKLGVPSRSAAAHAAHQHDLI
jgi:ATP/maltotriose-dependent transcriptional regulator MalT